jgi:hypothetical protein
MSAESTASVEGSDGGKAIKNADEKTRVTHHKKGTQRRNDRIAARLQ